MPWYPVVNRKPLSKERTMDSNIFKGKWKQFRGEAKKQWGKISDDEMDQIEGDRDKLIGKLQEKYGYSKDQASSEVDNWMNKQKETV
jgi:uncharacterized protein YjbJ (UPF0337 family)